MRKDAVLSGTWLSGPAQVKVKLTLIIFNEENSTIVFCPALDLSGYGKDETEARKSFEVSLSEYLRYTVNKKSLSIDLKNHGWEVKKNLKKSPVPPTIEDLNNYFLS